MSKVFITKYPTTVNNDKLPVYGKIKIGINVSKPMSIGLFQVDSPIDAIGGNFLQKDLSTVIGSHIDNTTDEVNVDSNVSGILINKYVLNGNLYLNKDNIDYSVDISEFRYSNLSIIQLINSKDIVGDISSLSSMTQLTSLNINFANITGDISSLSSISKLRSINLSDNANITGDISSLSSMTQLTSLNLASTSVTGDISSIVNNLTALLKLVISPIITITDEQKTTLTNRGCTVIIR